MSPLLARATVSGATVSEPSEATKLIEGEVED